MKKASFLSSIKIELSKDLAFVISGSNGNAEQDSRYIPLSNSNFSIWGIVASKDNCSIIYDPSAKERGFHEWRFFENIRYDWSLEKRSSTISNPSIKSSLEHHFSWHISKKKLVGDFCIGNFLGSAFLEFSKPDYKFIFDIASKKLDFETEYFSMINFIGKQFQQLILDFSGYTALNFRHKDNQSAKIIYEQFIFLRTLLNSKKIEMLLEMILNYPDHQLEEEQCWGIINSSLEPEFFLNPIEHGRNWERVNENSITTLNGFLPNEVLHRQRTTSYDTPANRFIRFALEYFRDISISVYSKLSHRGTPVYLEAKAISDVLASYIHLDFFREIGEMEYLPLNNQVLTKRDGYKQLLENWLLVDSACQVSWHGLEEAFQGENRDCSLLYEYWIYFNIFSLLHSTLTLVIDSPSSIEKEQNFLSYKDNGLKVNLIRGKTSKCVFTLSKSEPKLCLAFFYNRTFSYTKKKIAIGSYSQTLRPDYTLAIFPWHFFEKSQKYDEAEMKAFNNGNLFFLHFDSKYKLSKFPDLTCSLEQHQKKTNEDIENTTLYSNNYQPADLDKMHTYLDAISCSIGSYLIYPGEPSGNGNHVKFFPKNLGIIPSVGAIALKPVLDDEDNPMERGIQSLSDFLYHVISSIQGLIVNKQMK